MSTSVEANAPPVDQSSQPAAEVRYGGFWVRFAAHCVDNTILFPVYMAVIFVLFLKTGGSSIEAQMLGSLLSLVVGQLYHGYFVASERMATPGKRFFGLYVTDIEGRRLDFRRALGRNVAAALSYITLSLGFVMAAFYPRKQALHDVMANTLVKRQPGASTGGMIFVSGFVFLLVFVGGIVYAVGKSTFIDYGARLGMEELYEAMSANKLPVQEYAKKHQAWPTTWEQVESANGKNPMNSMEAIAKLFVKDVRIEEYGAMVAVIEIDDKLGKLRLAPHRVENRLRWTCVASADIVKYAPEDCGIMK